MARQPRGGVPEGIYHVFARGNDRQPVFVDDIDRESYLALLAQECLKRGWLRLAYCLMTNHFHLLLETSTPDLSDGMGRLQSRYVQRFNRRHERSGHLFQERFGAVRVTSDAQLSTVTNYIANNPVEAGLCTTAGEWEWADCAPAQGRCREIWGPA